MLVPEPEVLGFVTTSGYLSEEGFTHGGGYWLVALVQNAFGDFPGLTIAYSILSLSLMGCLAARAFTRVDATPQDILADVAALTIAALFVLFPKLSLVFPRCRPVHRPWRRRHPHGR